MKKRTHLYQKTTRIFLLCCIFGMALFSQKTYLPYFLPYPYEDGMKATATSLKSSMLPKVYAVTGTLNFNQASGGNIVGASGSYVEMDTFLDAQNNSYFIDPASTTTALVLNGNMGIGTTTAVSRLHLVSEAAAPNLIIDQYNTSYGSIVMRSARGNIGSPDQLQDGDPFGGIGGRGYGDTGFASGGRVGIVMRAAELWTDAAQGADIDFWTNDIGSATIKKRMILTDDGNLGVGTTGTNSIEANARLTIHKDTSSKNNEALLSVDGMQIGQLEGGTYLGGIRLTENQWQPTNYGETWMAKGSSGDYYDIAMSSDGRIQTTFQYAGNIYISSDYGNTWTAKDTERNWYDVAMSSDGKTQTAVETGGQIYISSDYGNTWTAKDSNRAWAEVAMSSDGRIQTAVVYHATTGFIYTSSDYGNTWTLAYDTSRMWTSVAMSSDGRIQTAGVNSGYLYVSSDYGATWSQKSTDASYYDLAMSGDGKFQTAVAPFDQIYVSSDYGNTWSAKDSSRVWMNTAMSKSGKIQTATASSGQIYVSTDYGNTWTGKDSMRTWRGIAMSSDGKIMAAVVYGGQIYVSRADSYTPGGKLGIGTTSPLTDLDIRGEASASALYLHTPENGGYPLKISTDGYYSDWGGTYLQIKNTAYDTNYPSSGLFIDTADDTGENWTHSSLKLEINGVQKAQFAAAGGGADPDYHVYIDNITDTGDVVFRMGSGFTERMRLENAGNLGIGTSSPEGVLHVVDASHPVILGDRTSTTNSGKYGAVTARHTTIGEMADGFGASVAFEIQDSADVVNTIGTLQAVRDFDDDQAGKIAVQFKNAGVWGSRELFIQSDGNVGINAIDPLSNLHIVGTTGLTTPQLYLQSIESDAIPRTNIYGMGTSDGSITYGGAILYYNGGVYFYTDSTPTDTNNNTTLTVAIDNAGKFGIFDSSPDYVLDVAGNISTDAYLVHNDDTDTYLGFGNADTVNALIGAENMIYMGTFADDTIELGDDGDVDIKLSAGADGALFVQGSSGNVGIGDQTPAQKLRISSGSNAMAANPTNEIHVEDVCYDTSNGLFTWMGVCGISTIKAKERITPLSYGLSEILKLHPVSFNYKKEYLYIGGTLDKQIGLIAENVEPILPEIALYDDNGDVTGFEYDKLTVVLINAAKEQQDLIESLVQKNASIDEEVTQLEKELTDLESELTSLEDSVQ